MLVSQHNEMLQEKRHQDLEDDREPKKKIEQF
jgi:hypothetical protein